ncbi:MAG: HD domain-containing protein [Treponema sp.]|jgi:putative two-component system response regulator|nr:HD domain-containing protein [Treponema sp.]
MQPDQKKIVPGDGPVVVSGEKKLSRLVEKNETLQELQNVMLTTISNLIECRNDIADSHVERINRFLTLLVNEMIRRGVYRDELGAWDIKLFLKAAKLHDVGKIGVKDSILMKDGPLTQEEFAEMKRHTTFGEMIIEKIQQNARESDFLTHAKIIAGTHHERWDGTGYPRGIAGSNIPLQGRLMAIVDVYDALASERPYKRAFPPDRAVQIIKAGSGIQFDPALIDSFTAAAKRFYQ